MKQLFSFMLLSALLFCNHSAYCQLNKDSLWARSARAIQKRLQLSDSVTALVSGIVQEEKRQLDELDRLGLLHVEDRGRALKKIRVDYEGSLRKVMTTAQWKAYQDMEEAMQKRAIDNLQSKHIPYKELGS